MHLLCLEAIILNELKYMSIYLFPVISFLTKQIDENKQTFHQKAAWEDPGLDKPVSSSRSVAPKATISPPSPLWEGTKAFGNALVEPFSGAWNYWTGGRAGSDYADDSTFVDVARRMSNALPGPNQYKLEYDDPLLDASAISLGVSGASALAAPIAAGVSAAIPSAGVGAGGLTGIGATTAAMAAAAPRARGALSLGQKLYRRGRALAGLGAAITTPGVIQHGAQAVMPAVDTINTTQNQAYRYFIAQGYPEDQAKNLSFKLSWGPLLFAGKEYLSNPYHYIYRQGGANPIDRSFAQSMGSIQPISSLVGGRQGMSVFASGTPVGVGGKVLGYGLLNKLESIPASAQTAFDAAQNQLNAARTNSVTGNSAEALNALENSRVFNSLLNYYNPDINALAGKDINLDDIREASEYSANLSLNLENLRRLKDYIQNSNSGRVSISYQ